MGVETFWPGFRTIDGPVGWNLASDVLALYRVFFWEKTSEIRRGSLHLFLVGIFRHWSKGAIHSAPSSKARLQGA